jgi:hypothetical protein
MRCRHRLGFGVADSFGRQVIDLSLSHRDARLHHQGDENLDRAGWGVSEAGDVNGDGFGDLIVGAPFGADGGTNAGEAYVVFGTATGVGVADSYGRQLIDLSSLTAAQGSGVPGSRDQGIRDLGLFAPRKEAGALECVCW